MATVKAVWGIDLGRCALKAIKLRPGTDGKVEIVAYDYIEHPKILSQPDADRNELIRAALEQFLSRNDISKDQVVVSVPGQHTLARFSKLPPVAAKRIPDIVRYEADQQIPFDLDEVIWDYQTFQEEGLPDIEVGIFAMKRELIREHLLHFEQASIEPIGVQTGPLAAYNAGQFDGQVAKETTILLDMGAESTDLIIGTPTRLWTRAIPIGGNSLSDALVKSFKLSFAKAESLKRTAASTKYARQTFQAMQPVLADLVQELQRSLGFYSSTHREAKFEKIVCFGDAFLLPGLQKYLQQNLGLDIDIPVSFQNAVPAEGVNTGVLKEHIPSTWVAYGLALQGLDLAKVTSNLLPTEIAKQVVWRKKRPAFAAAAACLMLCGALVWFRLMADRRALASGGEGVEDVQLNLDQALGVIDNGPSSVLSDRAKAKALLEAGKKLNDELKKRAGQGDTERADTVKLREFQANQVVVPRILQIIHDALPPPEGPFAAADTPEKIREAAAAVPRKERRQVHLDSLLMDFVPDVNNPIWSKSIVEVDPPLQDVTNKSLPGFVVKITCTTPNQKGSAFIKEAFMDPLVRKGREPGAGFYFHRVWLIKGSKVEAATAPAAGRGAPAGRGSTPRGGAAPKASTGSDLDPITYEPTDEDWRFEIWADVIMTDFSQIKGQVESPQESEEETEEEG